MLEKHERLERLGHGAEESAAHEGKHGGEASPPSPPPVAEAPPASAGHGGTGSVAPRSVPESAMLQTDAPGAGETQHPGEAGAAAMAPEQAGLALATAPAAGQPPSQAVCLCRQCSRMRPGAADGAVVSA